MKISKKFLNECDRKLNRLNDFLKPLYEIQMRRYNTFVESYNKIKAMEEPFKMPTETVELPSQGLIYPESSPLSSGKIEMKYMTAREEDILTNQNYISKGTVLDELIKSLIVSDVDYGDLKWDII